MTKTGEFLCEHNAIRKGCQADGQWTIATRRPHRGRKLAALTRTSSGARPADKSAHGGALPACCWVRATPLDTKHLFLISPELWNQFYDAPRRRASSGKPRVASQSARRAALRRTKTVVRGTFRGASCNQGSARITAMSPSPSLSCTS